VLQHPVKAAALGLALAARARAFEPSVVLSPALGGLIIGHEVARGLGVRAIFAERSEARTFSLRRGFSIASGERVLVIEDVLTTGKSTREVMDVARDAGGVVVGVAAIIDRSGGGIDFAVPSAVLVTLSVPTYTAEECPLCANGVPVVKPGSRPG
jgi:orotate phosphoribosyltransferase